MANKVLNDHNGGVTENTFFHHVRALEDLKKQATSVAGKIRAQKKLAKDDGLDIGDLDWAMKQRAKTLADQVASHNRRTAYLRFWKMPLGAQIDFVDEINDETAMTDEQRQEKWENDGYVAGLEGKGMDVALGDHDPNSIAGRFILEGWRRGQEKLGKGIKKKDPEPKPAKEKATAKEAAAPANEKPARAGPQDEPEVAEAKKRGRPKTKGVTYWHHPEIKKVYEIDAVSEAAPEGAVSVTRPEYDELKAKYAAELEADWDDGAPKGEEEQPPAPGGSDADEQPPAPGSVH